MRSCYEDVDVDEEESELPLSLDPLLPQTTPGKPDMLDVYKTRAELVLATRWHSYLQGSGCLISRQNSGGRRRVFLCKDGSCPYQVTWAKRQKRGLRWWQLDRSRSVLRHAVGCESEPQITQDLLVNNTDFASTIVNDKSSSAKTLERAALNAGLGTASTRALNRVKQTVLHNNADDYE